MTDNKGNRWTETCYEGYGVFGGKDFYELLAEMNGQYTRRQGIDIAYGEASFKSPNLTEDPKWKWKNQSPSRCEFQGFFYDDEEGEENEE
jgi:hypothetical protein